MCMGKCFMIVWEPYKRSIDKRGIEFDVLKADLTRARLKKVRPEWVLHYRADYIAFIETVNFTSINEVICVLRQDMLSYWLHNERPRIYVRVVDDMFPSIS
jgi:hypothetical protein